MLGWHPPAGPASPLRKDKTMGYDIVTVDSDQTVAEQFAKEHNYTYLFDKDGNYDGGAQVYFRVNIWGMGVLANCMSVLLHSAGVDKYSISSLMNKISFNQGDHIDSDLIDIILDAIDSKHGPMDTWVDAFVLAGTLETWSEKWDGVPAKEKVQQKADWTKEILVEWIAYLRIAKTMGGCLVW
jgi:hypothetical protein